jgi:hypothetical protein
LHAFNTCPSFRVRNFLQDLDLADFFFLQPDRTLVEVCRVFTLTAGASWSVSATGASMFCRATFKTSWISLACTLVVTIPLATVASERRWNVRVYLDVQVGNLYASR